MTTDVCRIIIDAPASGAWNMAVDDALLAMAVEEKQCFLRWYRWSEPTLSLGYFQTPPTETGETSSLPQVRRLSGGGAIIHDQELTYSCAIPAGHPLAREPQRLYSMVHETIGADLREAGFPVSPRGETRSDLADEFLCFGRGDSFDLVVNGVKVLGSAQRRRKGAVLQHGSLILRASKFAPQFPGLRDLCPEVAEVQADEWIDRLARKVGVKLAPRLHFEELPAEIRRRIADRIRNGSHVMQAVFLEKATTQT